MHKQTPDTRDRVAFGNWLKKERQQRGLTQSQAAKSLGICPQVQAHREAGLKRCTHDPQEILRLWDVVERAIPPRVTPQQLREAMSFTGLSMEGLSKALGKSRGTVGRYLRDDTTITVTCQQLTGVLQEHVQRL